MEVWLGGILSAFTGFAAWYLRRLLEGKEKRKEAREARWDKAHAKAVDRCNEQLSLLVRACGQAFDHMDDPAYLVKGRDALGDFRHAIRVSGMYIDDDLRARLNDAAEKGWAVLNRLKLRTEAGPPPWHSDQNLVAALGAIRHLANPLSDDLRKRFRALVMGDEYKPPTKPPVEKSAALPPAEE